MNLKNYSCSSKRCSSEKGTHDHLKRLLEQSSHFHVHLREATLLRLFNQNKVPHRVNSEADLRI